MKKPIRIDSIPALKGTELSSEFKQNLQEQYNDILIYNLDKPEPQSHTFPSRLRLILQASPGGRWDPIRAAPC